MVKIGINGFYKGKEKKGSKWAAMPNRSGQGDRRSFLPCYEDSASRRGVKGYHPFDPTTFEAKS